MVATVSGMMAGQWFGGTVEALGWRAAFVVLSLLFLTAASLLWRQSRAMAANTFGTCGWRCSAARFSLSAYLANTAALLRMPRVRWVLTVVAVEGALAFGTLAFVPARMVDGFGLSASAAGGVMVLYGVGGLIYSLLARRWLALLGERGLALVGASLIAGSCGLLLLAWGPVAAWRACWAASLLGWAFTCCTTRCRCRPRRWRRRARGTAVTLFACLLFLGQSLGGAAGGGQCGPGLDCARVLSGGAGALVLGALVSRKVNGRVAAPAGA